MAVLSLIISAVALLGVMVSLLYQYQQTRIAREESMRTYHRELSEMAINDPALRACWTGGSIASLSDEEARQALFANMVVSWWLSVYLIKEMTDDQAGLQLEEFFRENANREYWARNRMSWRRFTDAASSKRERVFIDIVEVKFHSATTQHP
ncbi:DUF6082 family protein [Streptomyces sp. MZ04]|uniref:DUF6082 family protein n=1 Tax=Streptomyces sp. MZ04 TaxID=2559236 RepID=UPI00107ED5D0|nr:DUF6082 family protein [Streptomyces sp. MZ04]TGB14415.1 hypothetical protein E2651_06210 [Streptomyces sp. MZ04]